MSIRNVHDMDAMSTVIGERRFLYHGTLPRARCVLISSEARFHSEQERLSLYLSALEAALAGCEVMTIARRGGMFSIIKGVEDGQGRLHSVSSSSMELVERRFSERALMVLGTGGSLMAAEDDGAGEDAAIEAALSFSSVLITTGRGRLMTSALDHGIDVAVLRSSLSSEAGREAARDGAPVIDTFSSFMSLPSLYAYRSADGRYGFGSERFDIMRL